MADLTVQTLLTRLFSMLIIAAVYGATAAAAARRLGDPGPGQDGRLTASPLAHLDVLGGAALVLFGFGWIKPLDLTPARLRGGIFGAIGVVLAATIALLVAAAGVGLLLPLAATMLPDNAAPLARTSIASFVATAASFALVNLIPLPPLASGVLLDAIWPAAGTALRRANLVVGLLLIAALVTDYPQRLLEPAAGDLARLLMAGR